MLLKRGRYTRGGERGRSKHWPSPGQPNQTASLYRSQSSCCGLHLTCNAFFLKILKQHIMVCTFSTLLQTMMRCYSILRAILSLPLPVEQVHLTDRLGLTKHKHQFLLYLVGYSQTHTHTNCSWAGRGERKFSITCKIRNLLWSRSMPWLRSKAPTSLNVAFLPLI